MVTVSRKTGVIPLYVERQPRQYTHTFLVHKFYIWIRQPHNSISRHRTLFYNQNAIDMSMNASPNALSPTSLSYFLFCLAGDCRSLLM